jgi:aspartyl protease family protein
VNGDDTANLVYAVLGLTLILSSLLAYRLPIGKLAKMIMAWLGIFALLFLMFSFRPELKMVWNRLTGELTGAPRQTVSGEAIQLTLQDDGHFRLRATINDKEVDFMVDSGASFTAISANTADDIGIDWRDELREAELNTANGVVKAKLVSLDAIMVGDHEIADHTVVIAENFGDTNVVGMNFLKSFSSWNVEGDVMTLRP